MAIIAFIFIFIFFYRKCLEFSRLACGLDHGRVWDEKEKTPLRIDELTWKGFLFSLDNFRAYASVTDPLPKDLLVDHSESQFNEIG